ncbi:hypothetical protein, partial [Escherichia coli]|uniref:hypothetical protein n=1 Tax=Escherichia coli TaxID=562 RepID=UPI001963E239
GYGKNLPYKEDRKEQSKIMYQWCEECCSGKFTNLTEITLWVFENKGDAMLFKLRWMGTSS